MSANLEVLGKVVKQCLVRTVNRARDMGSLGVVLILYNHCPICHGNPKVTTLRYLFRTINRDWTPKAGVLSLTERRRGTDTVHLARGNSVKNTTIQANGSPKLNCLPRGSAHSCSMSRGEVGIWSEIESGQFHVSPRTSTWGAVKCIRTRRRCHASKRTPA